MHSIVRFARAERLIALSRAGFPRVVHTPRKVLIKPQCAASMVKRSFATSLPLLKKGGKASRGNDAPSKASPASDEDPLRMDDLNIAIQSALTKLKDDLSKLRSGGRFNPETLEEVRVSIEKGSTNTERLGDLASVVPKGRTVTIIVSDPEHTKPISSAVLGSKTLNLNPQQDPNNANQLIINLPPPTADSRKLVVQEATKAADAANNAIKNARGAQQKKLRAAETSKTARPDDVRTAGKSMEKVASDANAEVKKVLDAAKKVLDNA